jgi:RimJ/RimL family protein N-acetyltransferase
MIHISKAKPADAELLAQVSKDAFDNDIHYGAPGPGGPPGYDSPNWQAKMMRLGDYYKIEVEGQIVGGFIALRRKAREYELGRVFIAAEHQNRGIGTEAMEFLWQKYPLVKRWTLDTPAWNTRTRHFYQRMGFAEIGKDPRGLILFERWIPAARPDP